MKETHCHPPVTVLPIEGLHESSEYSARRVRERERVPAKPARKDKTIKRKKKQARENFLKAPPFLPVGTPRAVTDGKDGGSQVG
ncbi:hypothetical protein RUM43_011814 [Polyplax serrata]|uniref:Uncharacterized protein n=1 Tax=Polyplax serrata TaxID=468196 RepID=A0AAN8PJU3_POLSC